MRRVLLFAFFLGITKIFYGQDVEEIKQNMYDEKYQSAEDISHVILKTDPSNAEVWYWLTQACLEMDKIKDLEDTLRFVPDNVTQTPLYKVAKGSILMKKNKADSAWLYFDKAIADTKQKDPVILSQVAKSMIDSKSGNAGDAIELLNNAIKRDKNNPELYTLLGDAYRKSGSGEEAYKAYMVALMKDEKHAAALYRLGKIFVTQKNPSVYLDYFNKAIEADPKYVPALYELYYYYYFVDPAKSLQYFEKYKAASDVEKENDYLYADLLYLNKQYSPAIEKIKQLSLKDTAVKSPRIYKLLGYCYLGLKDSANALANLRISSEKEADTSLTAKDFETLAELYKNTPGKKDSAVFYYQKAADAIKDTNARFDYYKKLADLNKDLKNYSGQAAWIGKFYTNNPKAGNVDLFNWGVAHYKAEEYQQADTVFGLYIQKYPEQAYGYYWRARANVQLDTSMQSGAAIPWYKQLIEVLERDTANKTNKKWLIEAYGYIAAYATNTQKDYKTAIEYLNKVLVIDPANKDAKDYIAVLNKNMESKPQN